MFIAMNRFEVIKPASTPAGFFGILAVVERAFLIVQLYHIFRLRRAAPCPPLCAEALA